MKTCALLLLLPLLSCCQQSPVPTARADPLRAPERLAHFEDMPKVLLLPDGTLAAYILQHRGPGLPDTEDVQRMRVCESSDNGKTWGEPRELFALPKGAGGFGYFERLVDHDGEVHFFLLCDDNTGVVRPREKTETRPAVEPIAKQRLDIWHVRSADERTNWTRPKQIWKGRAGDLQSVIQLKSGRIVLPICYYLPRSWSQRGDGFNAYTFTGQFDTTAMYSDDGGETWTTSPSVTRTPTPNLSAYGAVEPVALELTDGSVWALMRTSMGRFWEIRSRDGGATWTPARPTAITSSESPAGLVRLPDGRIVMIWNNCQRYPYAAGARRVLHAAVSSDEGKTWRGCREILRDPKRVEPPPPGGDHGVSYPYVSLMRDGRVLYSMWVQTGEGRSIEAFDPNWLMENSQRDDFAGDLEAWHTYGTKGAEIASSVDGARDGKALALQTSDRDWPCGAVRNFPGGRSGSVKLRIKLESGSSGAVVQLTDHFSAPFDLEDRFFSPYALEITANDKLEAGKWIDLQLRWDGEKRMATATVDGKPFATLPSQRDGLPISYLRIRPISSDPERGRLLIDDVHVEVTP
jgi:hypothetical protein